MRAQLLKSAELIDQTTEIHYAFHKSLKSITAVHTHDFYEFFLIVKGETIHFINGKEEILKKNTLVFIRPQDKHSYQHNEKEECELINLAFPEKLVTELFNYAGEGFNGERLLNTPFPPQIILPENEKDILAAKFEELNLIPRENKYKIKSEFRVLIAEIFFRYFKETVNDYKGKVPAWLINLREEMRKKENFAEGIKRFYELTDKSPEHLSRIFKKHFNETPTDYINYLRLNYAANLLSNTDHTIIDISMETGFENLSHFYHLFKRQFGMSPKEFREKHTKLTIPL